MELTKYGVSLQRLTEDKIEMVRNWRNDPKIARFMEFRDIITPEMQQNWFTRINNDDNYYFIILFEQKEIGLINIRDIDHQNSEGEGGIFIYDDAYLNSEVSFRATLCLTDFGFETLHLKRIIAHILADNKRAIEFNKFLGFKIADHQEEILNKLYYLIPNEYYARREIITRLFK